MDRLDGLDVYEQLKKGCVTMVLRQFKQKQFPRVCRILEEKGSREPLDVFYTIPVKVDGWIYSLRVLPTRHCQIVVLQTVRRHPDQEHICELFTQGTLLSALLEIVVADVFLREIE